MLMLIGTFPPLVIVTVTACAAAVSMPINDATRTAAAYAAEAATRLVRVVWNMIFLLGINISEVSKVWRNENAAREQLRRRTSCFAKSDVSGGARSSRCRRLIKYLKCRSRPSPALKSGVKSGAQVRRRVRRGVLGNPRAVHRI